MSDPLMTTVVLVLMALCLLAGLALGASLGAAYTVVYVYNRLRRQGKSHEEAFSHLKWMLGRRNGNEESDDG